MDLCPAEKVLCKIINDKRRATGLRGLLRRAGAERNAVPGGGALVEREGTSGAKVSQAGGPRGASNRSWVYKGTHRCALRWLCLAGCCGRDVRGERRVALG